VKENVCPKVTKQRLENIFESDKLPLPAQK
jgi:hypothetical protein